MPSCISVTVWSPGVHSPPEQLLGSSPASVAAEPAVAPPSPPPPLASRPPMPAPPAKLLPAEALPPNPEEPPDGAEVGSSTGPTVPGPSGAGPSPTLGGSPEEATPTGPELLPTVAAGLLGPEVASDDTLPSGALGELESVGASEARWSPEEDSPAHVESETQASSNDTSNRNFVRAMEPLRCHFSHRERNPQNCAKNSQIVSRSETLDDWDEPSPEQPGMNEMTTRKGPPKQSTLFMASFRKTGRTHSAAHVSESEASCCGGRGRQ
jgi:hypothetical protein